MAPGDNSDKRSLTPDEAFSAAVAHHGAGRLADAEAIYRKILAAVPGHPGSLHHLGLLAFQTGNNAQALGLIDRALAVKPDYAEAHCNRGVVLRADDDLAGAVLAYQQALAVDPAYADAWANLAGVLIAQKLPQEAEVAARKAVSLEPAQVDGWNNLGTALLDLERASESVEALGNAIRLRPDSAESYYNFGNALKCLEQLDRAAAAYRQAISLNPDLPHPHNNLAGVLLTQDRDEEALVSAQTAARLAPGTARIQTTLGNALRGVRRVSEAAEAYRRAVAIDPAASEAWNNLGGTLNALGDFTGARDAYRAAIAAKPGFIEAYRHLAMVKKFESRTDPEFEALCALSSGGNDLSDVDAARLDYALAKAYADLGEYDTAFAHYVTGGAGFRRHLIADPSEDSSDTQVKAMFDRLISVFDQNWVDALSPGGDPSDMPIFIVGMPRSGTTLVEQILASHPAVDAGGELDFLGRVSRESGGDFPAMYADVAQAATFDSKQRAKMGAGYVSRLREVGAGAPHITDKMPGNYRLIGLIAAILPNARILHCVREPLDVCVSCFTTGFAKAHGWSYDLEELGHVFADYRRLMRHWHTVLPGRVLDVSYEELVAAPEPGIRRFLAHCGLPWDEACLSFHKHPRPVLTASAGQVRQPLYQSSVGRWRKYEKHLGPLIAALGDEVSV